MTRLQLHKIFSRHRGELAKLALEAGVKPNTIATWFKKPFTSANIERLVKARALELLKIEKEQREAAAAEKQQFESLAS